jgi:hypothetical protein
MNNLKQLTLAMFNYVDSGRPREKSSSTLPPDAADGYFPTGCLGGGTKPEDRLSWQVGLLPFLEQDLLHHQFDMAKGYAGNLPAAKTTIKIFRCPTSAPELKDNPISNYVAMAGIGHDAATRPAGANGNGMMGYDRLTSLSMIKDGTSNTIAMIETEASVGPWARGGASTLRGFDPATDALQSERKPFGAHANVINAAMLDGSVRPLDYTIDPRVLAALITIAGGEAVDSN